MKQHIFSWSWPTSQASISAWHSWLTFTWTLGADTLQKVVFVEAVVRMTNRSVTKYSLSPNTARSCGDKREEKKQKPAGPAIMTRSKIDLELTSTLSTLESFLGGDQNTKVVSYNPLDCTVLNCNVLYCTVLYRTVLYCTVPYRTITVLCVCVCLCGRGLIFRRYLPIAGCNPTHFPP